MRNNGICQIDGAATRPINLVFFLSFVCFINTNLRLSNYISQKNFTFFMQSNRFSLSFVVTFEAFIEEQGSISNAFWRS